MPQLVDFTDPGQTYSLTLDSAFNKRRFCSDPIVARSLNSIQQYGGSLNATWIDWDLPPGPNRLFVKLADNRTATYDFTIRGNPEHGVASKFGLTLSGGEWTESELETLEALKENLLILNASYPVTQLRWRAK